ncbi:MAG: hypothetical protein KAG66_04895, partial [Methylococcales bacterium]|nr:hypothetical protein [Methylococcales bacterium]
RRFGVSSHRPTSTLSLKSSRGFAHSHGLVTAKMSLASTKTPRLLFRVCTFTHSSTLPGSGAELLSMEGR